MIEVFVPVALTAALSLGPAAAVRTAESGVLAAAAGKAFSPRDEMWTRSKQMPQGTSRRDSVRNGAVTGAIAGGLGGVVLGSLGCAVGEAAPPVGVGLLIANSRPWTLPYAPSIRLCSVSSYQPRYTSLLAPTINTPPDGRLSELR